MGLSPTNLARRPRGFSLAEVLTVLTISSLLLVVLATLFKTGMWEVGRSSGRIEVVRRGRQTLDQMQRYLSTAIKASGLFYANGSPVTMAIYTPLDTEIYDPSLPEASNPPATDRVRFFTPIDHLGSITSPGARSLQATPVNHGYEITAVPGVGNQGQDVVLRKLLAPPSTDPPFPLTPDTGVRPRYLGRRLGVPDSGSPGGYRDGFVVRRLREGAIQIDVNLSSDLVTDDLNQRQLEQHTPLRIRMRTIYQPPVYNL